MREFMNILEAKMRKPKVAPVDTSSFRNDLLMLMRSFSQKTGMRFKRDWVDMVVNETRNMIKERPGDDLDFHEALVRMADKVWTYKETLFTVKQNVEQEISEYQQRAAERHDRLGDPDFYIESSDYLTAMNAMVQCASDLSLVHNLSDPRSIPAILSCCNRFVETWEDHLYADDGGEAPILDEAFVENIENLLPLVLMLYRK